MTTYIVHIQSVALFFLSAFFTGLFLHSPQTALVNAAELAAYFTLGYAGVFLVWSVVQRNKQ